jgi:hypothetical protein
MNPCWGLRRRVDGPDHYPGAGSRFATGWIGSNRHRRRCATGTATTRRSERGFVQLHRAQKIPCA